VADFPAIVAHVTDRCKQLWWPDCHQLLLCWRIMVVLLLLLQAIAPELWWRVAWLSRGWCIDHAVLQGALLELPLEGPYMALLFFFSSITS
jgi:hypothetical protein